MYGAPQVRRTLGKKKVHLHRNVPHCVGYGFEEARAGYLSSEENYLVQCIRIL